MGMFHVFVEGPVEPGPDAMRRLAEAMHGRYGLPAAELVARMSKGRFRVKGNIDGATASVYARDLEAIGARVTVEAAPGSARPDAVSLPPANARGATSPTPAPPMRTPTPSAGLPRSTSSSPR